MFRISELLISVLPGVLELLGDAQSTSGGVILRVVIYKLRAVSHQLKVIGFAARDYLEVVFALKYIIVAHCPWL